jgi:LysM repeat protein
MRPVPLLILAMGLGACADGLDLDFRGSPLGGPVSRQVTEARPEADARGVISYPGYQVALARAGDTPSDVAGRVGLAAEEVASFNGLPPDVRLREGEVLALPRRVGEPVREGAVDITTLAGAAIDRASPPQTSAPAPQDGREPIRHEVARGETAFTIARAYGVPVRALAEWNGLGPELTVREGQFLLIPVVRGAAAEAASTQPPGTGSRAPVPPSAAEPLPEPEPEPEPEAVAEAAPDLSSERTVEPSAGRLRAPVQGAVIRDFQPGTNDGVDFAAPAGTTVSAAAGGTVAAITEDTEGVPILVLRHEGDLLTVYANIDDLAVAKGDRVSAGQALAEVREGGSLHFEVREGFEAVDPSDYLD